VTADERIGFSTVCAARSGERASPSRNGNASQWSNSAKIGATLAVMSCRSTSPARRFPWNLPFRQSHLLAAASPCPAASHWCGIGATITARRRRRGGVRSAISVRRRRYGSPQPRGRRGKPLAKRNVGAYVSVSQMGRFRVIDPTPPPQGAPASGASGRTEARARERHFRRLPCPIAGCLRPKRADVRRRTMPGGRDPGEPLAL